MQVVIAGKNLVPMLNEHGEIPDARSPDNVNGNSTVLTMSDS